MRIIRRLLLLIMVAGIMSACQEKFESHYPSATAADKAGAFDHGRIPDLLKPDVTDIREWYDIDSSEVRGRFALNPGVLNRLKSSCTPATDVPRRTRSMPEWFPVSITSGDAAAQGMSVFAVLTFMLPRTNQPQQVIFGRRIILDLRNNSCTPLQILGISLLIRNLFLNRR
jgi:hypothetical protein